MANSVAIYQRVKNDLQKRNLIVASEFDATILSACIIAEALSNEMNMPEELKYKAQGGGK